MRYICVVVQPSPPSISRTLSSSPTATPDFEQLPISLSPQSPGNMPAMTSNHTWPQFLHLKN